MATRRGGAPPWSAEHAPGALFDRPRTGRPTRDRIDEEDRVTPVMYGIRNCDTIKKARAWLDARGVAYAFHDYKASGIDRARLEAWVAEHGWPTILNRAGTTFRALPDADRDGIDAGRAIALMLAQPSMIKRPVLDLGGRTLVGFKPDVYAAAFA